MPPGASRPCHQSPGMARESCWNPLVPKSGRAWFRSVEVAVAVVDIKPHTAAPSPGMRGEAGESGGEVEVRPDDLGAIRRYPDLGSGITDGAGLPTGRCQSHAMEAVCRGLRGAGKQGKTDADLRMGVLGERRPLECFCSGGQTRQIQAWLIHGAMDAEARGLSSNPFQHGSFDGTPNLPACVTSTRPLRDCLSDGKC